MKNLLILLRIWLVVLTVSFVTATGSLQAEELLHLESGAFEIRLKRHQLTSGESAEILRIRSATAEQAGIATKSNPGQIIVSLPSPHPQIDGLLPVSGSETVKEISFEDKGPGGQITITLHKSEIPHHVWDKKLGALMIAFSLAKDSSKKVIDSPTSTIQSATQVRVKTRPSAPQQTKSVARSLKTNQKTTLRTAPEFRASFKTRPSNRVTPVRSQESRQASTKLVDQYLHGIEDLTGKPQPDAAFKKNSTRDSNAPRGIAAPQVVPASAKYVKNRTFKRPTSESNQRTKHTSVKDEKKGTRKVQELALALLTPDDETPAAITYEKAAPRRVAKTQPIKSPSNSKRVAFTKSRPSIVNRERDKTIQKTAARAALPPKQQSESSSSDVQALKGITFVNAPGEKSPALQLALNKKASFSIAKKTANTYGLTIPNCSISKEHLELPYFPPVAFKGLTFLQPTRRGENTIVDMVVERGYKLKAVSSGNNIIVKTKSLL